MVYKCPKCHKSNIAVVDSRKSSRLNLLTIRRRRECSDCKYRFTTYEVLEVDMNRTREMWRRRMHLKEYDELKRSVKKIFDILDIKRSYVKKKKGKK